VEASIEKLFDRLGLAGPSESEIIAAQRRIAARIAYETDTLGQIAHRLAYYEALDSWELAESIRNAVDEVTAADIQRYVKKYLRLSRRTTGIHIPAEIEPEPTIEIPKLDLPDPTVPPPSPVPEQSLRPLEAPTVKGARTVLSNGVVLQAASRSGASGALRLRLALGSELDPPGKEGLAMLAAQTLFTDSELSTRLGELGAQWSSSVESSTTPMGREYFDLQVRFLPEDRTAVVREVANALGRRQWHAEAIERLRSRLREDAAAAAGDAAWVAERKAVEMLFPSWRPTHGTATSLDAIGVEDVTGFVSKHLVGSAVTAGLACPGDVEALIRELSSAFGDLPSGELSPPRRAGGRFEPVEKEIEIIPMEGKTQSEIVAALPGVERSHPDYLPLRLLNYILGETGYAGRLGKKLVDTGLAYSVYAIHRFGRRPGPLLIETSAAPANLETSLSRIKEVIRSLGEEGVEEWEWRESQAFRLGRLTVGIDSVDDLALSLVDAGYYGEDALDFESGSKRILATTRERLNEVARRYFRPELLRVGVAGKGPVLSQSVARR
jgi:zinc protease